MEDLSVAKKKAKKSAKVAPFTPADALMLMEAHGLDLEDEEEDEMLKANNPELFGVYERLKAFAHSAGEPRAET